MATGQQAPQAAAEPADADADAFATATALLQQAASQLPLLSDGRTPAMADGAQAREPCCKPWCSWRERRTRRPAQRSRARRRTST